MPALLHVGHDGVVDFAVEAAGAGLGHERLLEGVGVGEGGLESGGGGGFAGAEDVGHLLPVSVEAHAGDAEVEVEDVAGEDDGGLGFDGEKAAGDAGGAAAALEAEVGLEPGGDVVGAHLVIEPAADVADGGFAGVDDFIGEGAFGELVGEGDELGVDGGFGGEAGVGVLLDEVGGGDEV